MRPSLALCVSVLAVGGACEAPRPPPPDQPVSFSHRVHAGDNEIGCTMCHAYAEHSTVAGIPSVARCRGCHRFVDKDKPEVQKIFKAYDDGAPLQWSRVHRLPDHTYFTHERHVRGGVGCHECHGDVKAMEGARQVAPLTMGWCVDCHRERGADVGCTACHK